MDSDATRPADVTPSDAVLRYVREVIAGVLGMDETRIRGALDELAMDSLARMNITARFDRELGEVPTTLTFDHQTVEELAVGLRASHPAALTALLGGAGQEVPTRREAPRAQPAPVTTPREPVAPRDTPVEDIAVIGVSGRYPGSPDVDALWETLRAGADRVTEIPEDRWDWRRYYDERRGQSQKTYGKWGAFLDDVSLFDAEFFHILPSSAAEMDPQERLFLETSWNLLEEAGYLGTATHEKSTGVFVGTMYDTYGKMGATGWPSGRFVGPDAHPWLLANRVSYQFDFQGPSFAVNSACSSSLTAVHLACESLRREECRMAVAGGANLILHPAHLVGLASMNMLASDGRCKVFDARADGYVPGEGVGAVLLKPLHAALADNDRIWGVIKASSVNTAGRTSGFTVPSTGAQTDLVAETIRKAGVPPATISYVEAHGTGTELGDPVEMAGLTAALRDTAAEPAGDGPRCAVGSVKANIGHLEGASGIAGLTKVLLQLRHRQIAPCIHLEEINPKIELSSGRIHFPDALTDWTTEPGIPRRAGVSAFGAGGANAHVIVEEYTGHDAAPAPEPSREPGGSAAEEHVFVLSARTSGQLATLVERTVQRFAAQPAPWRSLAYTSQVGRKEMTARLAVVARSTDEALTGLAAFLRGEATPRVHHGVVDPQGADALPLGGEEGASFLAALTTNRRLLQLAQLWTQGAPVDWSRLWPGRRPSRVSLPAYPFERKRYWVAAEDGPGAPVGSVPDIRDTPAQAVSTPDVPPPAVVVDRATEQPTPLRLAIERELRLIATTYLLVDESEVDVDADFQDLGFDSMTLVGLIGQLCDTYKIEVDAVIVFDYSSLRQLARYLEIEHQEAAAAHHGTADHG